MINIQNLSEKEINQFNRLIIRIKSTSSEDSLKSASELLEALSGIKFGVSKSNLRTRKKVTPPRKSSKKSNKNTHLSHRIMTLKLMADSSKTSDQRNFFINMFVDIHKKKGLTLSHITELAAEEFNLDERTIQRITSKNNAGYRQYNLFSDEFRNECIDLKKTELDGYEFIIKRMPEGGIYKNTTKSNIEKYPKGLLI
jgi:hypothetical protein